MTAVNAPATQDAAVPSPLCIAIDDDMDALLTREWLVTNRIGAYASSTVVGCNTRRYHGLLIASASPPVARFVALSTLMETLSVDGETFELATNEFDGAFSPRGVQHLVEFRNDVAATFVYRAGGVELTKEVVLADAANAVAVRYTVRGAPATLRVAPFLPLRDFHHLRRSDDAHQLTFEQSDDGVMVQDLKWPEHSVHFMAHEATFEPGGQWWNRFRYRTDIARGQEGSEDLYCPGCFTYCLDDESYCQFTASADQPITVNFPTALAARQTRRQELAACVGDQADEFTRRLAVATDAFVARRSFREHKPSTTILAGFPWFADWGRDTFIALPGLLLCTGRFEYARQVFRTFVDNLSEGMIPNCFDDYSGTPHYNSIDASLWFIIAAERYLQATDDVLFWRNTLMPACNSILTAYHDGTRFDIRADADGLLTGGSRRTQLTWMDAKLGEDAVTPRHGKAVEINALWHSAHRIMAQRCRGIDDALAERCRASAELIADAFVQAFWNERLGCLYDCIKDSSPDASIRPNQILAVSLPHSALPHDRQADVVRMVAEHLLTPVGLRTLAPEDDRYRRRYGESWESRDRAYHQGTVWAWLMGPFIEAYLKVDGAKPLAVEQARTYLSALETHLGEAGLGFISEIFDGDPPHTPRGCIAQAWSVAEVLRAKLLIEQTAQQINE